jgi:hypothetical protein
MRAVRVGRGTVSLEHTLTGESVDLETDFVVAHAGTVSKETGRAAARRR